MPRWDLEMPLQAVECPLLPAEGDAEMMQPEEGVEDRPAGCCCQKRGWYPIAMLPAAVWGEGLAGSRGTPMSHHRPFISSPTERSEETSGMEDLSARCLGAAFMPAMLTLACALAAALAPLAAISLFDSLRGNEMPVKAAGSTTKVVLICQTRVFHCVCSWYRFYIAFK